MSEDGDSCYTIGHNVLEHGNGAPVKALYQCGESPYRSEHVDLRTDFNEFFMHIGVDFVE